MKPYNNLLPATEACFLIPSECKVFAKKEKSRSSTAGFSSLIVVEIKHERRFAFETADKTENLCGLLNRLVSSGRVLGVCHLISY